MRLVEPLLAIAIVILGIIAWASIQLLRELRQFRLQPKSEREAKDGQTINVNLGASGLAAPAAPSPPAQAVIAAPEIEPAEAATPEPESEPEPQPRRIATVTVTSSGAVAVKCPKCGAENSAFRSECFMCDSPLR